MSDKRFQIILPDSQNITIFYDSENILEEKTQKIYTHVFNHVIFNTDFEDRIQQLKDAALPMEEYNLQKTLLRIDFQHSNVYNYCLDHWAWYKAFDKHRWNYEDRVKSFLERCGTFLLLGHLGVGGVITEYRNEQIKSNELALSNTSSEIADLFFSSIGHKEYTRQAKGQNIILTNEILSGNIDPDFKVRVHKKRKPKAMKRFKDSQYYKIKQLHKTEDVYIQKLYKLKNKDISFTAWREARKNSPAIAPHREYLLDKNTVPKDVFKIEGNKPFRNLHGENLYEYRPHAIKGNHKGIIDPNKPYSSDWCYVWTDNVFELNEQKYRINDSVEQYMGRKVKINRKGDTEIKYDMDKILVYEQDGKRYYFDQNINRIDDIYISLYT